MIYGRHGLERRYHFYLIVFTSYVTRNYIECQLINIMQNIIIKLYYNLNSFNF